MRFPWKATVMIVLYATIPAEANTIFVKKDATGGANGLADGTTWDDAFPNLDAALIVAASGDQIWVAGGHYTPEPTGSGSFRIPDGVEVYGGFLGSETTVGERDPDPLTNDTVLSGDLLGDDEGFENRDDNSGHVVVFDEVGSDTVLDGFTIRGGEATGSDDSSRGGGILSSGNPVLRHLHFTNNRAFNGGAIASLEGEPVVQDCRFSMNEAIESGGAILLDDRDFNQINQETATIVECRFLDNTAGREGGAIRLRSKQTFVLNSEFDRNTASLGGGGISILGGMIEVIGSRFWGNEGSWGGGAALRATEGFSVNNRFLGNTAAGAGGGMSLFESSIQHINCLFSGNQANEGGALSFADTPISLLHCTIVENTARTGAGLVVDHGREHFIKNSVIWNNNSIFGYPADIKRERDTFGHALHSPNFPITLTPESGASLVRGGLNGLPEITTGNPLFINARGPDGIAGTLDDNLEPSGNSPLVGKARPIDLPADRWDLDGDGNVTEPLPLDAMGRDRMVGPGVDIGALESSLLSYGFSDIRLPRVPDQEVTVHDWTPVDPNNAMVLVTRLITSRGTLSFASDPVISTEGSLSFEVTPSTSGTALFAVVKPNEPDEEILGHFHIIVSPTVHFVNHHASQIGNGSSWDQPFLELYDAMRIASEGDEIRVTSGTYLPAGAPSTSASFHLKQGVKIRGGFRGFESGENPDDSLAYTTLSGYFPLETGPIRSADQLVRAEDVDESTLLESVIITGGGSGDFLSPKDGTGFYCLNASPTLRRVAVLGNLNFANGAGAFFRNSKASLDRCFFGGNQTASGRGGGLYTDYASALEINNSIFSGNRAVAGGAIYFGQGSASSKLINCTLAYNWSFGAVEGFTSLNELHNCILFGNARSLGGPETNINGRPFDSARVSNSIIEGGYRDLEAPQIVDTQPLFANPDGPDGVFGTLDDDYHLLLSSPALNQGDQSRLDASLALDFRNQSRISGPQIDIGAIEGAVPASFFLLHPNLSPDEDANRNGRSNFEDYALGGNPESPSSTALSPRVEVNTLIYHLRNNDPSLASRLETSTDLLLWRDLEEFSDFTIESPPLSREGRTRHFLQLRPPGTDPGFFRQILEQN